MNTKSCLLAGLLTIAISQTANNGAECPYDSLKQQCKTVFHNIDLYAGLMSPECSSVTQLALDSTLHRSFPMQSQASVMGLSSLWSYAFASENRYEPDTSAIATTLSDEVDSHSSDLIAVPETTNTKKLVAIVGSKDTVLHYGTYSEKDDVRLDIYVSDDILSSINVYGAKKLGIKLVPSDNTFHIYNKADFQFMTLLLSLGGDDGWNFIHIPNCKQKRQTFDTNAWIACTSNLRAIASDYLDNYQADEDNTALFEQSQALMPGATMLLLDSYRYAHGDMRTKQDYVVRYAICQTIKRETKSLWLAKMGKKIGF